MKEGMDTLTGRIPARDGPVATHGTGRAPGPASSSQPDPDAAIMMLREAIEAQPADLRAARVYAVLVGLMPGRDLERLGDNLSRAGHMKARSE